MKIRTEFFSFRNRVVVVVVDGRVVEGVLGGGVVVTDGPKLVVSPLPAWRMHAS